MTNLPINLTESIRDYALQYTNDEGEISEVILHFNPPLRFSSEDEKHSALSTFITPAFNLLKSQSAMR